MLITKNKVLRFNIFFLKILFLFFCYSYVSADSNTIQDGGTETDQQNIDGDGQFLTVKNSSTLATGANTKAANVTGDSVTVINTLAALSSLTDEQKDEIKRNVEHLEIIKAYKKEDNTTSIWTSEDFTAQDAAVTLGKTKY